jgi:hypothetical protein
MHLLSCKAYDYVGVYIYPDYPSYGPIELNITLILFRGSSVLLIQPSLVTMTSMLLAYEGDFFSYLSLRKVTTHS